MYFEVGNDQAHDGSFVQLRDDGLRKRESVGQIGKYFGFSASPASCRIPGFLFPFFRIPETINEVFYKNLSCQRDSRKRIFFCYADGISTRKKNVIVEHHPNQNRKEDLDSFGFGILTRIFVTVIGYRKKRSENGKFLRYNPKFRCTLGLPR